MLNEPNLPSIIDYVLLDKDPKAILMGKPFPFLVWNNTYDKYHLYQHTYQTCDRQNMPVVRIDIGTTCYVFRVKHFNNNTN